MFTFIITTGEKSWRFRVIWDVKSKRYREEKSHRPATSWGVHYTISCNTQSSAPEDGQNNCPKHVELTGIVNRPLLLHLVGCLYYLYFILFF